MRIRPDTSIKNAFSAIVLRELKHINKWQKVAIKGQDPEGVHQLRISLRKLRSALLLFSPLINTDFTKSMNKAVKRYAKQLNFARDLDVYIENNIDEISPEFAHICYKQQKRAYRKVTRCLQNKTFQKNMRRWKKKLKSQNGLTIDKQKDEQLAEQTIKRFALAQLHYLREQCLLIQKLDDASTDEALHRLRIEFKQLRYACEFFRDVFDKEKMIQFISVIKVLQDELGSIHDCAVVEQLHHKIIPPTCNNTTVLFEKAYIENKQKEFSQQLRPQMYQHYADFISYPPAWATATKNKVNP